MGLLEAEEEGGCLTYRWLQQQLSLSSNEAQTYLIENFVCAFVSNTLLFWKVFETLRGEEAWGFVCDLGGNWRVCGEWLRRKKRFGKKIDRTVSFFSNFS